MSTLVLAVESATYVGTVAVIRDGEVVAERSVAMRGERAERLMPAVVDALDAAGVMATELTAVACGGGPGSFTSLRIAASIAKGITMALGVPLVTASSLTLVVAGPLDRLPRGRYVATLDAMRGEVFAQEVVVTDDGAIENAAPFRRGPSEAIASWADEIGATVVGPTQGRELAPHARGFSRLLGTSMVSTANPADWEPEYGRKAEAQVKWEAQHGRELADAG